MRREDRASRHIYSLIGQLGISHIPLQAKKAMLHCAEREGQKIDRTCEAVKSWEKPTGAAARRCETVLRDLLPARPPSASAGPGDPQGPGALGDGGGSAEIGPKCNLDEARGLSLFATLAKPVQIEIHRSRITDKRCDLEVASRNCEH